MNFNLTWRPSAQVSQWRRLESRWDSAAVAAAAAASHAATDTSSSTTTTVMITHVKWAVIILLITEQNYRYIINYSTLQWATISVLFCMASAVATFSLWSTDENYVE